MAGLKNVSNRAVGVAGNALKFTSSKVRTLLGNFTEGALVVLFLVVSVISILQKHPNVALSALAATLGVAAFSESLALGLAAGLVLFGIDAFLRFREPFANPDDDEEGEDRPRPDDDEEEEERPRGEEDDDEEEEPEDREGRAAKRTQKCQK
jgi:hypothetical protein